MAKLLCQQGAYVVATARRKERLEKLKQILGDNVLPISADISKEEDCRKIIDITLENFGQIDVVINNAGISMNAKFEATKTQVFKNLMDVNYFGPLYLAKYSFESLKKSQGRLYFISSVVGKRGFPTRTGYSGAKFAVQGLFESLRAEWSDQGIQVGIISPGFTDTEIRSKAFTESGDTRGKEGKMVGKVMSANFAAEKIISAIKKNKREVVLTGAGKLIVGINKFFPRLADKLVARSMG